MWLPLAHPLPGTWPATQACALTGNHTGDPLVRTLELNSLSSTSQGWGLCLVPVPLDISMELPDTDFLGERISNLSTHAFSLGFLSLRLYTII